MQVETKLTLYCRWVKQYGGIVRYYHLFGEERVLIADSEAIRHVLVTNSNNYIRVTSAPVLSLVPDGLFVLNGSLHRSTKKLLNPSFNNSSIQS